MTQHPRLLRLAVGGALLAAVAFSGSAGARTPRPPVLTESTVITATQSGWLDVALYDDATLSVKREGNPDTDVTGAGRFVALTMTSREGTPYFDADMLSLYRTPSWLGSKQLTEGSTDAVGKCTDGTEVGPTTLPTGGGSCTYSTPKHILLREGYYRISVLTDGSPVTFTLTLHGLDEGTTTLSPNHALASVEKTLPKLDGADNKLVTFGATAHAPKAEPAYLLTAAKGSVDPAFWEESTCVRQDGSVPAPPLAYGPHCPNGVAGSYWYTATPAQAVPYWFGGMGVFSGSLLPGHEGDYGIGGSFGDTGGVTLTNALGVWLQPTP
jgi:hypothetical protein